MDAYRSIGSELRILGNLVKRKVDQALSEQNLDETTSTHSFFLAFLHMNTDRDIFQRDLEQEFGIRRSTVTKILQLMEKNGMLTRVPVDYDARLKKLRLTEKAIKIFDDVSNTLKKAEKALTSCLTEDELYTFFSIIDKLKRILEE